MSRHRLISSVKDEGPFLLEWVAHHLVLGFDRISIASNDCRDGSDHLLAAMAAAGFIDHVPNIVAPGEIPQHAGYTAIRSKLPINDCDWLMVLDADEFLNIHIGAGLVGDLTNHAGPDCDIQVEIPEKAEPRNLVCHPRLGLVGRVAADAEKAGTFIMFPPYEFAWGMMTRPLAIMSGVLILIEDLPEWLFHILWWNPAAHIVATMRSGFYPFYETVWVSPFYVFIVSGIAFVLGLISLQRVVYDALDL